MNGTEPILGHGLRVVGRVRGDGDLRVEAEIRGEVSVSGELHLEPGASVTGGLTASSIVVAGNLEGDAVATTGTVTITSTGSVHGDIEADEVSLEEGGRFHGAVSAQFDLPEDLA